MTTLHLIHDTHGAYDDTDDRPEITTETVRTALVAVREVYAELLCSEATLASPRLSHAPSHSSGIDRPIPGGKRTVITGPWSAPIDGISRTDDDTPVVDQVVREWAQTVARLRRVDAPRTLAASFDLLSREASFIASTHVAHALIGDLHQCFSAIARCLPTETVDASHDDREQPLHLPALAAAVPAETMLTASDADRFWPGIAVYVRVRQHRGRPVDIMGPHDGFKRWAASVWRLVDAQRKSTASGPRGVEVMPAD